MVAHGKIKAASPEYSLKTKEARLQLCQKLVLIRQALDKTQKEMGIILGVDQATICRWESGKWKSDGIPRASLVAYSIFQGCSVAKLLGINCHKPSEHYNSLFIPRKLSENEIVRCRLALESLGILDPTLVCPNDSNIAEGKILEALQGFICGNFHDEDNNIIIISKIEGNYNTQYNKVRRVILNQTIAKNGLVILW